MPSRRLPTATQYKREAQVNRVQKDLHKLDILACLSQNAQAVLTGTSMECEGCDRVWKCERFRRAIGEVRI